MSGFAFKKYRKGAVTIIDPITEDEVRVTSDGKMSLGPGAGTEYVDRSVTLSGSSQALVGQSDSRKILIFYNNGSSVIGMNFVGGAAALNTPGTLELEASAGLVLSAGDAPTNAINVIGTAGQPFTCYEG